MNEEPQLFEARQLALPFVHKGRFIRSDFIAARSNAKARAWLESKAWPEHRLMLWGESGVGKTHLLHLWAQERQALYLPGTALDEKFITEWANMKGRTVSAIALDDADTIGEERLFLHFLNTCAENACQVLMTARKAACNWSTHLADLQSRLRAMLCVQVEAPDDELLRVLLLRHLAERQLVVSQSVVDWLLQRIPRTAATIRDVAFRLDQAALNEGRAINRALAQEVIRGLPREE